MLRVALILVAGVLVSGSVGLAGSCTCPNGATYSNWMPVVKKKSSNFKGHIYSLENTSGNGVSDCKLVVASDELVFIGDPRLNSLFFGGVEHSIPLVVGNGLMMAMRNEEYRCSDMAYVPRPPAHVKVVPVMSSQDSEVISELELSEGDPSPKEVPRPSSTVANFGVQVDSFPFPGDLVALGKTTVVTDVKGSKRTLNPGTFGIVGASDGVNATVEFYSSGLRWKGLFSLFQIDFHILNFGHWEMYKQQMTKLKGSESTAPVKSLIPAWDYLRALREAARARGKKPKSVLQLLGDFQLDDD